jgi:hypothetical protein
MEVSGQRHAPAALYPRGKDPGTHCTGGWVGPRAGLNTEVRGKILCPFRGSNPDRPVVQPVIRHHTDWANPAPSAYPLLSFLVTHFLTNLRLRKIRMRGHVALRFLDGTYVEMLKLE